MENGIHLEYIEVLWKTMTREFRRLICDQNVGTGKVQMAEFIVGIEKIKIRTV